MDFSRILISCVAVLGLSRVTDAGCVEDISSSQGYKQCILGYSMYMSNAASSVDQSNQNAMMSIMCSEEGKSAMQCVLEYVEKCPDILTSGDSSAMLQGFQSFKQFGGLEAYCASMSGPCMAVQQCLKSSQATGGDMSPPSSMPTPFSVFQSSVYMVCGPLKGMFGCFKDVGDMCKAQEDSIKTVMDMGRAEAPAGTTYPTYEQTKSFAMKECSKLPADFTTNSCVNKTLVSDMFVKCYENVTLTYPPKNNQISCDAYKAGHECISMSVGKKCGDKYTKTFIKVAPLFLQGLPTNCKLDSSPVGSANLVHISSLAIFGAFIFAFRLM